MSCTGRKASTVVAEQRVDSLNEIAYRWHYRQVDSVRKWATLALQEARRISYVEGEAEALNHLSFERLQKMDFDSTLQLTLQVEALTSDPIERLVADVTQMRVAQRTSDNLAFFRHRTQAQQYLSKFTSRKRKLSPHRRRRLEYGSGDMHIVASTYFYYLDQQERAIEEIDAAEPFCLLASDTAQWLYYSYMRGSGGLSRQHDPVAVASEEFDYLLQCFWVSRRDGYLFFEANAEQSLATLFADSARLEIVRKRQPEVVHVLETSFGTENPAMQMAEAALTTFVSYDDLYQKANALRTLGELSFAAGNYPEAISYFDCALECVDWQMNTHQKTVPMWIANIREQMSVAYSALDMKAESDFNRNAYLDLLADTREDAELESRVEQLKIRSDRQRLMLIIIVTMAVFTCLLVYLLARTWRRHRVSDERQLQQRLHEIQTTADALQQQQMEAQETLQEQQAATELRLLRDKRLNVEKRAKLQLVMGIVPFLDRIIHEVQRMKKHATPDTASLTYIGELTDQITRYNDLLTDWIQMEQGQLSLHISSFSLQPLFDSLSKSHFAYEQKGLELCIEPTELCVKADRALTLFMLNTLADNARKFTPEGGTVSISAMADEEDGAAFVELSVQDTGVGLTEEDIELILTHKVYDASKIGEEEKSEKGFGFGLMNCKGIIEKYRKTNPLFRVCQMGIDSSIGEGSRFWFRLPRVVEAVLMVLLLWSLPENMAAQTKAAHDNSRQTSQVYALADSVYECNVSGRYADAIAYADSAFKVISRNHVTHHRNTHERLSLSDTGLEPLEILWWQRQEPMDYSLLLGLRNEIAVAALALHDWPLYRFNNRTYTRLYKLTNQDPTLEAFCEQSDRDHERDRIGLVMLVMLILTSLLSFYFLWLRPRTKFRKAMKNLNEQQLQQLQQVKEAERLQREADIELAEDEHNRRLYEEERLHVQNQIIDNCLSTIKHETMYYPGRIQQLAVRLSDDTTATPSLLDTLSETVDYYKEVHSLLSEQAVRQSEALNFRRRNIAPEDFLAALPQRCQVIARKAQVDTMLEVDNRLGTNQFRGDPDLLQMLIEMLLEAEISLTKGQGSGTLEHLPLQLTAAIDGSFARFTLSNPFLTLTPEALQELFMPHEQAIPLLVAKQIIREHDTFLGHPGCRIAAEALDEGHALWFTLPLVVSPTPGSTPKGEGSSNTSSPIIK